MKFYLSILFLFLLAYPISSYAQKGHHSNYAKNVKRDKHGHIARSEKAKHDFMNKTGYALGRKGYVIDHIVPMRRGGCDCPDNMQWQTIEAAKRKDKTE